ncbi:hypothetical protein VNO77_31802 [Canavalia gladiata]|uniref:TFIIS N-terminal domain-containing protein n=1 Tax=Canavalia gladiata TaxID=3824 RepID=A0AAN9KP93_CANGL
MEKELVKLYEAAKKAADTSSSSSNAEHEESRCIDALQQLKNFPVNYKILVNTQVLAESWTQKRRKIEGVVYVVKLFISVSFVYLELSPWKQRALCLGVQFSTPFHLFYATEAAGEVADVSETDFGFLFIQRRKMKDICFKTCIEVSRWKWKGKRQKVAENFEVGKHLRHLTKHPRQKIQAFATDLIEIWKGIIIKETSKTKNGSTNNKVESHGERVKAEKDKKTPSVKIEKEETVMLEKIDRNGTPKPSSGNLMVQNVDVKIEKTDSAANIKVEKIAKEEKQPSGKKRKLCSSATPQS